MFSNCQISLFIFKSMSTGCALDVDGNLKNAFNIDFYASKTDTHPLNVHKRESGSCFVCYIPGFPSVLD